MRKPTLLLTRPLPRARQFAAELDPDALARITLLFAPLMEISPTGPAPAIVPGQGVIFTSAQGVLHGPAGQGRPAWCVGATTTRAAREAGWEATEAGQTADALIAAMPAQDLRCLAHGPLLHLAGEHQRGDIAERLSAAGIETQRVVVYRQTLLPLPPDAREALAGVSIVPLFSPRTAAHFAKELAGPVSDAHLVALSDSVSVELRSLPGANLYVTEAPTAVHMRKTVENLCLSLTSA